LKKLAVESLGFLEKGVPDVLDVFPTLKGAPEVGKSPELLKGQFASRESLMTLSMQA